MGFGTGEMVNEPYELGLPSKFFVSLKRHL